MDFMEMLADWRRVLARSVLAFHVTCAAMGLVMLLGVISVPFMAGTVPGGAVLATAAVTGLLCLLGSCALGGGVRYAVYGDFRLLPSRSFRSYFSGDDDGGEGAVHVPPPLPARTQTGHDDELIDRVGESVMRGDLQGFSEIFNRLQGKPAVSPGEISEELAPRIRELGLEHNCRELWEQGYTVVEDVAPPEFWRDLRAAVLEVGHPGAITVLPKHPRFAEAAINHKLMALAEFSVGAGFILSTTASSIRRKGDDEIGLHCDQVWMPVPFPEHNLFLTACWACDDFTPESGPTTIVPGSAAQRRPPSHDEIDSTAGVPILCKAGSVAVWDGRLWHSNATRTIDGERAVLHVAYTRLAMRPMEVYPRSVQDRLVEQYGEPMAQLMGRYDFLATTAGKGDVNGFLRAVAYSRR